MAIDSFNPFTDSIFGTTGTGLDQIVTTIAHDRGLAGRITGKDIAGGAAAANTLNALIVEAARATHAIDDGKFDADDVLKINEWIRADANRLKLFTEQHGDDECRIETGFHLVQNDGAVASFRGQNFVNTVADGIFHIGFEVKDGYFVNEDGNQNASVQQVADWLNALWTDHSSTGTGLDRVTDLIVADKGLSKQIPESEISAGADAADDLNQMIADAIGDLDLDADGRINSMDVVAINQWIRSDEARFARFVELHGDDENGSETGFHLVQNDGASTRMFGQNFVNTVADGMYHIGFEIKSGRFLNEDGNKNAKVTDVADWLDYFYSDVSTTETGLDWITDSIKSDKGLACNTRAGDINGGARAANDLNHLILDGLNAVEALNDGVISVSEVIAVNGWIQEDKAREQYFVELHGDDEDGEETGYHLVQNDGGSLQYRGQNLINTVADGIYHIGFDIRDERFDNEDGNPNATVADVTTWLNSFVLGKSIMWGTSAGDKLVGLNDVDTLNGEGGDDCLYGNAGNDTLNGGDGCDTLCGGHGDDVLVGGLGRDILYGNAGADTFVFAALEPGVPDVIKDFKHGEDKIVLGFLDVPDGGFTADNFVAGTAAKDADDWVIWDARTGCLYFDADGTGQDAEQMLIATLNKSAQLAWSDFAL
ncbi:MAG: hypothetical protein HC909_01095 [Blastochloris sp.]|nr:hypothetical protein [Blastochloris sp.]